MHPPRPFPPKIPKAQELRKESVDCFNVWQMEWRYSFFLGVYSYFTAASQDSCRSIRQTKFFFTHIWSNDVFLKKIQLAKVNDNLAAWFFETLKMMEWPTQSLDLNPIEQLWDELVHQVNKLHPTNKSDLCDKLWREM